MKKALATAAVAVVASSWAATAEAAHTGAFAVPCGVRISVSAVTRAAWVQKPRFFGFRNHRLVFGGGFVGSGEGNHIGTRIKFMPRGTRCHIRFALRHSNNRPLRAYRIRRLARNLICVYGEDAGDNDFNDIRMCFRWRRAAVNRPVVGRVVVGRTSGYADVRCNVRWRVWGRTNAAWVQSQWFWGRRPNGTTTPVRLFRGNGENNRLIGVRNFGVGGHPSRRCRIHFRLGNKLNPVRAMRGLRVSRGRTHFCIRGEDAGDNDFNDSILCFRALNPGA